MLKHERGDPTTGTGTDSTLWKHTCARDDDVGAETDTGTTATGATPAAVHRRI